MFLNIYDIKKQVVCDWIVFYLVRKPKAIPEAPK